MEKFNEDFEIDGYWWFPEKPDNKVAGTLYYSSDAMRLELMGTLTDVKQHLKQFEYPIIHGISTKGQQITLHKCYASSFSMGYPSFATSKYAILQLFIGLHFQKEDNIKFNKVYAYLTHFDEWMGVSGFFTEPNSIKENDFHISYSPPKEIKFEIDTKFAISIWFGFNMHTENMGVKEQSIKQNISISIDAKEELQFAQFMNILADIRNFLGLACLNPIYPLEVKGLTKSNEQKFDTYTVQSPISIYFQQYKMPKQIKELPSMHMLFTYRDISDDIGHYFRRWFENKSILEPIYNLYSEILHSHGMMLDQQFLLLMHAVEAYHRRTSNETEVDTESHEQRISAIISDVPDKYKEWLKIKLQFSNELSLRKRLDSLLNQFPFVLEDFDKESKPFTSKIVDIRNYLAHYSNNARPILEDGHKIFEICQRLKLLLESALLFQLGFDNSKIELLINKSKFRKGLKDNVSIKD
ncbi:MAG: hypothetical protein EPO62_00400 [Candidatus Nitrosotenuis sp.]|nr:MAG: hypothetical protein EPO62_00400 [Candidatus Nitrosotenuis sp.]